MKPRVLVAWTVALAAVAAIAAESGSTNSNVVINLDALPSEQPAPATKANPAKNAGAKGESAPSSKSTTAKGAAKKNGATKKKEPPREVEGFSVSRGDRGFLGIKIQDNTFRVSFYDKDKKPIPADVASIALRWPVPYQPNPERTVLTPVGDGKVMSSEKTVRPPFHFKLFITLLKGSTPGETSTDESYVVDFAQ